MKVSRAVGAKTRSEIDALFSLWFPGKRIKLLLLNREEQPGKLGPRFDLSWRWGHRAGVLSSAVPIAIQFRFQSRSEFKSELQ
jgi:hypothetical protein